MDFISPASNACSLAAWWKRESVWSLSASRLTVAAIMTAR
jgi:hypothetical protein